MPDLPGLAGSGYLTSDTLWEEFSKLDSIPRRIAVMGGGPIGAELAQAITMQEAGRLIKVPGIGKKTAERLLLEISARAKRLGL